MKYLKKNHCSKFGTCFSPHKGASECRYFKLKEYTKYKCEYKSSLGNTCYSLKANFYAKLKDLREMIKKYNIKIEDIELDD